MNSDRATHAPAGTRRPRGARAVQVTHGTVTGPRGSRTVPAMERFVDRDASSRAISLTLSGSHLFGALFVFGYLTFVAPSDAVRNVSFLLDVGVFGLFAIVAFPVTGMWCDRIARRALSWLDDEHHEVTDEERERTIGLPLRLSLATGGAVGGSLGVLRRHDRDRRALRRSGGHGLLHDPRRWADQLHDRVPALGTTLPPSDCGCPRRAAHRSAIASSASAFGCSLRGPSDPVCHWPVSSCSHSPVTVRRSAPTSVRRSRCCRWRAARRAGDHPQQREDGERADRRGCAARCRRCRRAGST